ncbi:Zn-dependent protease [Antricoccus suffuscus]|uniref:Zinc metalloprotease n=1 Tax=Antricoccus suffuscus TaxID=1629062 RepID=A0A2T1A0M5_9ACTN|nr:site-2 protease family protein [Antricoccus suffuscus]PRZ42155.1 Zn-dependent protease [Antricoccus suffuscus]
MTATGSRGAFPTARIGRFLGAPIYVSASWLWFALIVIVLYARILHGIEDSWPVAILFAAGLALLWGLSVLLHELGHVAAARLMKSRVYKVEVGFLGGVTTTSTKDERPSEEFWVSIAGPAVSLALAAPGVIAAFAGSTLSFGLRDSLGVVAGTFTLSNLAVAVFNMLPGLPLDGGRVLVAMLWRGKGDQFAAARTAATVGQGIAIVLLLAIALLAVTGTFGPGGTPLLIAMGIVAVMLWFMARDSRRATVREQRLADQSVSSHIEAAAVVSNDTSVRDALALCDTDRLVVINGGAPTGIATRAALETVPGPIREATRIDVVAQSVGADDVLTEAASMLDVLTRFTHNGTTNFIVTAADGMVIGVVSVESVTSSG